MGQESKLMEVPDRSRKDIEIIRHSQGSGDSDLGGSGRIKDI